MNRDEWLRSFGLDAWTSMVRIREFETRLGTYVERTLVPGSIHQAIGMEAVAVGVSQALRGDDIISSGHRAHAHCLAKGADPGKLLAEIFGRTSGYCLGRGGSMHIAAKEVGILGTSAIVGDAIGMGTGAALAIHLERSDRVAVAYFGDGAVNQGIFHESLNLASIWKLPCLYVCENNHYAQSSSVDKMSSIERLSRRGDSYGIPGIDVDGMDVYDVFLAADTAIARARAGEGPTLLVADTYRFMGHNFALDTERYRPADEVARWRDRDPIPALETSLLDNAITTPEELATKRSDMTESLDRAEQFAIAAPIPRPDPALGEAVCLS